MKLKFSVQETPASFITNFDAVKKQVENGVKKYGMEVTFENYKEADAKATELNKLSQEVNKIKKEKIDSASVHIVELKNQIGELTTIIQDGRTGLLEKVAVFKDKIKAECLESLDFYASSYAEAIELRDEFYDVDVSSLVTVSQFHTSRGDLIKKLREGVEARVPVIF